MRRYQILFIVLLVGFFQCSCRKFLDIPPPKDQLSPNEMFADDANATSAVTGIYSVMAASGAYSGNQNSITVIAGLAADELKSHTLFLDVFYKNDIPSDNLVVDLYLWTESYKHIYTANTVLEALGRSTGVSEALRRQLEGEVKFVRAFCYFNLVNLFGAVPLHLKSDYRLNEVRPRSPVAAIYQQLVKDLLDAESLLASAYWTGQRTRPNKAAARALLARVYLYSGQYEAAAQTADEVISESGAYELLGDLNGVFLKNSKEAIWQLMPPTGQNTNEGNFFILNGSMITVSLASELVSQFEDPDLRKSRWINDFTYGGKKYNYPFKYKIKTTLKGEVSEYSMVFRLAEQYLIRAEARAKLGQVELALRDLNAIRKRAGLVLPLADLSAGQCLDEVAKQRRLELFAEWGHRWFDLKRSGQATPVLSVVKSPWWQETDLLFPIPNAEVLRNPGIDQNPGYRF